MDITNVTIWLAFLAGLASFLSPCVLSLVPAYVGFISGQSAMLARENNNNLNKKRTFFSGLFFVLGFSTVFILLGVASSALGGFLYDLTDWIAKIGGVIIIVLGLHITGIIQIPFLMMDVRFQQPLHQKWGYLSAFLLGVFFSAGWSPCVGPVLGAILTLSLQGQSLLYGTVLLAAYSLGLAIPFLIAALGLDWVMIILKKYGKVMHIFQVIMGVVLIIVGVLLLFDIYSSLARFGQIFDFGL